MSKPDFTAVRYQILGPDATEGEHLAVERELEAAYHAGLKRAEEIAEAIIDDYAERRRIAGHPEVSRALSHEAGGARRVQWAIANALHAEREGGGRG